MLAWKLITIAKSFLPKESKEKNTMKKILCLFLAVCLLCASLVACNDSVEPIDGGDKNGDWKNLDFGGATLTVSIANNETKKVTFQSASVYTKGPDNAATSEPVQKRCWPATKKSATT